MQSSSSTSDPTTPDTPPGNHWGATLLWITPVLFLLTVLLYGLLSRDSADTTNALPRVGQPLPDFSLPDLQGRQIRLSALRGKVVFINIWATWCPPCIEEMPTIQRLYERMHQHGLEVLTISIDPLGAQVVAPFMRDHDLTFPVLLDTKAISERLFGTSGVPESFIADKQGRLVEKVIGPRDWTEPSIVALFRRLLDTSAMN